MPSLSRRILTGAVLMSKTGGNGAMWVIIASAAEPHFTCVIWCSRVAESGRCFIEGQPAAGLEWTPTIAAAGQCSQHWWPGSHTTSSIAFWNLWWAFCPAPRPSVYLCCKCRRIACFAGKLCRGDCRTMACSALPHYYFCLQCLWIRHLSSLQWRMGLASTEGPLWLPASRSAFKGAPTHTSH